MRTLRMPMRKIGNENENWMNFTVKKFNGKVKFEQVDGTTENNKINRKVFGEILCRHVERSILCLNTHSDEQQTLTDSKIETTRQVAITMYIWVFRFQFTGWM